MRRLLALWLRLAAEQLDPQRPTRVSLRLDVVPCIPRRAHADIWDEDREQMMPPPAEPEVLRFHGVVTRSVHAVSLPASPVRFNVGKMT